MVRALALSLAVLFALPIGFLDAAVVGESPQPADATPPQVLKLREEAEGGSSEAAVELGKIYAEGQLLQRNLSEAERFLEQALEAREPSAYHPLGILLLRTSNNGQDVERAARAFEILRAAAATDPDCSIALGQLRSQGQFVKQDFDEAEKRFQAAADMGSANGLYWLGWLLAGEAGFPERIDPARAETTLEQAFEQGSIEAGRLLVALLRSGERLPKNEEKAFSLVAKAAESNSDARLFLGELYEEGAGVEASPQKALEAYRAAAKGGNVRAMNKLGLLYSAAEGPIETDLAQAREWFDKAAAQGLAIAHLNLALLIDTEAEPGSEEGRKAAEHLIVAAGAGITDAQDRLGAWYRDGRHVTRDLVAAATWFRPAAQAGNLNAMINLAQILEANIQTVNDLQAAADLYVQAANAGHPVAHFHLARLLASGVTGSIDLVRAHAHLAAAVKAGFGGAQASLQQVESLLDEQQKAASLQVQGTLRVLPWNG